MKTLKLFVIAFLILNVNLFANTENTSNTDKVEVDAQIYSITNDMIFVQLQNPIDSKVRITITDQKGTLLHNEVVKEDVKVLKRFDISKLPAGYYSCKVANGYYTIMKKIEKK